MSDYAEQFVAHLQRLAERDRAAMARLRRSLSSEPGVDPAVYPYVERFVGPEWGAMDARRLALYVVAGLFAMHPRQGYSSFAQSFGVMMEQRKSDSLEKRFIALLEADAKGLPVHLRHAISLLKAEELPVDYIQLLKDLRWWLNLRLEQSHRDRLRQRWAREFYRVVAAGDAQAAEDADRSTELVR